MKNKTTESPAALDAQNERIQLENNPPPTHSQSPADIQERQLETESGEVQERQLETESSKALDHHPEPLSEEAQVLFSKTCSASVNGSDPLADANVLFSITCSASVNESVSASTTSRFMELSEELSRHVPPSRQVRRTSSEKEHKHRQSSSRVPGRLRDVSFHVSSPNPALRKGPIALATETLSSTQSLSPFGRERLREIREIAQRHAMASPLSPATWDESLLTSPCPSPLSQQPPGQRPLSPLMRGGWVDPNELIIDLDETKRRHLRRRGHLSGTSTPSSEGGGATPGSLSPDLGSPQTKMMQRAMRSQRLRAMLKEIS